jgi:hypothetical protein
MAKHKLWAMAAAAGISAVLLAGCDDPGGGESPGIDYDDNAGIDDDLQDNSGGEDQLEDDSSGEQGPTDVATEPSE